MNRIIVKNLVDHKVFNNFGARLVNILENHKKVNK